MKPERLYTGQTMTQENFNKIVDLVSKLENKEIQINDDGMTFLEGDDLKGSLVSVDRDEVGNIVSMTQEIKETTNRTPFEAIQDNKVFENELIYNVDTVSDFQVLRKSNGTIIPDTDYSLNNRGQISFLSDHNENSVLVSNLDYWIQKTMYIGRDEEGNIKKISMEPTEDIGEKFEQDLIPVLFTNRDEIDSDFFSKETNGEISYHNTYGLEDIFNAAKGNETSRPRRRTKLNELHIDFKEKVIPTKLNVGFDLEILSSENYDFDLWGSNNKTAWTRILRVRGLSREDKKNGTDIFTFDLQNQSGFRYLKMEELSPQSGPYLNYFNLFGIHSSGIDMKNDTRLLGNSKNMYRIGDDIYNGVVRVSVGNKNETNSDSIIYSNFSLVRGNNRQNVFKIYDGSFLQYEFNELTVLEKYKIRNTKNAPKSWRLEGSIDGMNWERLDDREKYDWDDDYRFDDYGNIKTDIFQIEKPRAFKFYRITPLKQGSSNGEFSDLGWVELTGRKEDK